MYDIEIHIHLHKLGDDKRTSKKQAIAIGLSEARKEGGKVPKKS